MYLGVGNNMLSHLTESFKKIFDFLHVTSEVELNGVNSV